MLAHSPGGQEVQADVYFLYRPVTENKKGKEHKKGNKGTLSSAFYNGHGPEVTTSVIPLHPGDLITSHCHTSQLFCIGDDIFKVWLDFFLRGRVNLQAIAITSMSLCEFTFVKF